MERENLLLENEGDGSSTLKTEKKEFSLLAFEGPLDLLLHLIKKNEINIYDIPIGEITEQFLQYLDYVISPDLDNLVEFYSMAADLIYIKSKMLSPIDIEDEKNDEYEDARDELVEKLIEYQKYKKLTSLMEEKGEGETWFFERKKMQVSLPFEDDVMWERVSTWDLLKTFSTLVSSYNKERILSFYEEVSVNEKITLMTEFLEEKGECMFTDLLVREGNLLDIVCAFMALLEAVKFKIASIWQNRMFGDIKIKKWE